MSQGSVSFLRQIFAVPPGNSAARRRERVAASVHATRQRPSPLHCCGGTANILAKELTLPWDIPRAAARLVRGPFAKSLGSCDPLEQPEKSRYFLSVAGAGPDGRIYLRGGPELKARMVFSLTGGRRDGSPSYKFPIFGWLQRADHRRLARHRRADKKLRRPVQITTEADLYEDQFDSPCSRRRAVFAISAIFRPYGSAICAKPKAFTS